MKTISQSSPAALSRTGEGTSWHIYGRGNRGRQIFYDESDYIVFLALLKQHIRLQRLTEGREHRTASSESSVTLYAYGLRPAGYQLLMKERGIGECAKRLTHALVVSYEGYFHSKYHAKSKLFNDVHKSTKVENTPLLVELSVAMHRLSEPGWRRSSRSYYEGKARLDWLMADEILALAGGITAYKDLLKQSPPLLSTPKS